MRTATVPSAQLLDKCPVVTLGEVAELRLGKMLDATKNRGTPLPYLRNPNIRWFEVDLSDLREMKFEDDELEKFSVRAGDVLICEGGEAGRAAIWPSGAPTVLFQKAIHRVRTGPKLLNRYLVHRLMYDYFSGSLSDYYTGATIKHITGQDLRRYRFPLPSIDEQRRIVAILDQADALRRKRRAALSKLGKFGAATFHALFGDSNKLKAGDISQKLGEICDLINGKAFKPTDWSESGTPIIRIQNLNDADKPFNYWSGDLVRQVPIAPGDLLLAWSGTPGTSFGAHIWTGPAGILNQHIFLVKFDEKHISKIWLLYVINSMLSQLIHVAHGGVGLKHVTRGMIDGLLVRVPPITDQRVFERAIDATEVVRERTRASLNRLDALFNILRETAFNGTLCGNGTAAVLAGIRRAAAE